MGTDSDAWTTDDIAVKAIERFSFGHTDWRTIQGHALPTWPEGWYENYKDALAESRKDRRAWEQLT